MDVELSAKEAQQIIESWSMLTITQAAALLKISPRTIRLACKAGRLEGQKMGSQWIFSPAALSAWRDDPQAHKPGRKVQK